MVAVGVVAPAEVHDAVAKREDAVVAEGDAMGVAAEVGEHLLGPPEGRLRVDDPRPAAQGPHEIRDGDLGGQPPPGGGPFESREILGAEDLRERAHGEQEALASGQPTRAVLRQGSTRDDAVHVEVLREVLSPGVEDDREAELTAEMPWIAREGLE